MLLRHFFFFVSNGTETKFPWNLNDDRCSLYTCLAYIHEFVDAPASINLSISRNYGDDKTVVPYFVKLVKGDRFFLSVK